MALVAWLLVWAAGHGATGAFAFPPQTILPAAGVGIALAVGLGVSAFESDLPGYRFGWRQAASALAGALALLGALPVIAAASGGRWSMPDSGEGEATSWMRAGPGSGDFRVLWLGDPAVLPGAGWQLQPGLSYELTDDGIPQIPDLWPGADAGAAAAIAHDVGLARTGATVRLGQLLAPFAVHYVVVVSSLAPPVPGEPTPATAPPPPGLSAGLDRQADLRQVLTQGGLDVYGNAAAIPGRAANPGHGAGDGPLPLTGWVPVLPGAPGQNAYSGSVPAGTVMAALAPAQDWSLTSGGASSPPRSTAFGYAPAFDVKRRTQATLAFRGSWVHGLSIAIEVLLWIVALAVVFGGWRSLRRRVGHSRRRRRHVDSGRDDDSEEDLGSDQDAGNRHGSPRPMVPARPRLDAGTPAAGPGPGPTTVGPDRVGT